MIAWSSVVGEEADDVASVDELSILTPPPSGAKIDTQTSAFIEV